MDYSIKPIRKILVANRGEIAVRIFRTCREMGIATVAVYSEADRQALFVSLADEAFAIGPAKSSESYLCVQKIIDVAKRCGADAIHPGYGFLSEKAEFAKACAEANLIFIGPTADAIAQMGDKISARQVAENANVPIVPGTPKPLSHPDEVLEICKKFGYPILLKAAAGGGGKGMRVVQHPDELPEAFARASSEALQAFGDGRVFVEKYIVNPRHVEVQVLCDSFGQAFFLYERECSTQRRHQKIIEEAPCAYLREDVRQAMAEASLRLVKDVGYLGVGTLEYLVDDAQNFYFLEMNTRLQVEHTVTEQILQLDLVRLQIQVARGEKLQLQQHDIRPRGHAIQCRICAEDVSQNFLPSPGEIKFYKTPEGLGIRNDAGVVSGGEVSVFYDPMIAKLIVWDETRTLALQKLKRALSEYCILGVSHNLGFLYSLIDSGDFAEHRIHTQYLDQNLPKLIGEQKISDCPDAVKVASALLSLHLISDPLATNDSASLWWQSGCDRQLRRQPQ